MKNIFKTKNKIISLIIAFISIFAGLVYSDEYVIEDLNYYHSIQCYAPSIKQAEADRYLELHIAPADAEGISLNRLKILDTTRLKGLLIVNSTEDEYITEENIGHVGPNKNLEHSLTADRCAETIIIEVAYDYPTADTYLQGLIRVVGKRVDVVIKSATGVSINGATFHNMNELYISSKDTRDYNELSFDGCARNIRVNENGIIADCPVFFYSKHCVIDGPISMDNYHLTLNIQSACHFMMKSEVRSLGGLTVKCGDTFLNRGNLKIQGSLYVDAGSFKNEPHWYKAPWTQAMIDALDFDSRDQFIKFGRSHAVGWDDIDGRQYDAKMAGTGYIEAHDISIFAQRGDIINEGGGEIRDTGGKKSVFIAQGEILNQYRQCATEDGYFRDGFRIEPSTLFFSGDVVLHSEVKSIITDTSTFIVNGNAFMKAGQHIKSKGFEGRYLVNIIYHFGGLGINEDGQAFSEDGKIHIDAFKKYFGGLPEKGLVTYYCGHDTTRAQCVEQTRKGDKAWKKGTRIHLIEAPIDGPHRYHKVVVPSYKIVRGNSQEIAGGDILHYMSVHVIGGNADYIAEGSFVFTGVKIPGPPHEQLMQEVQHAIADGRSGSDVVTQLAYDALASQNRETSFEKGGMLAVQGILNIGGKENIEIDSATVYGKKGVNMLTEGDIDIHGHIQTRIKSVNDESTNQMIEHDFESHRAFVGSDGNINMKASRVFITGATVDSKGNTTIIAGTLAMKPLTASATNYLYKYKSHTLGLGESKVTEKREVSHTLLATVHTDGVLSFQLEDFECEGCDIYAKEKLNIAANNTFIVRAHEVNHSYTKDTTHAGPQLPGIGNVVIAAARGLSVSDALKDNIPMVGAVYELSKMDSATDLKPLIGFLAETYSVANTAAKSYEATQSFGDAGMAVASDQLGVTTVNGIPVPSSVGYGTTKTHHEKWWTEWFKAKIRSGDLWIVTKDAHVQGVIFEAEKDFYMHVTNDLYLKSQAMKSGESFNRKGHSFVVSFDGESVGVSGSQQSAKSHSESEHHLMSEVLAGDKVTFIVDRDAELEGQVKAPKVEMEVSGTLTLKTKQNTEEGKSSQHSENAGVSINLATASITPSGGFQRGSGNWNKQWTDEQTTIEGDEVEIKAKNLVLESARILGKAGYVDAETITHIDLENIDENYFSSYGADTNFVKFLIKPENARQILSTSNAIKGMVAFSSEDDYMLGVLRATISENLKVKTTSNIDGLNRDETQSQEILEKSSHRFSLAIPLVDWKELGEDLNRIGMTAKEISQKMQDAFESAKQKARTPEEKTNIEVQEKLIGDFYEILEENKVLTNLEKGEAFKDFVQAAISKECRDFIAVFNAKEQIIGQKPIEEASVQELLFLANAISQSTEIPTADKPNGESGEESSRLLEDYKAELAEYGIDIEVPETYAKHIPSTLVGKITDQVGNKIIQIEKGFDEIGRVLFSKIKDKPAVLLLWAMYHTYEPVGAKELQYVGSKVGEGALYSAEYLLGEERLAQAKEKAVEGIEYIIDHSTEGQRKAVGSGIDIASFFYPVLKSKTILAATLIGVKKGMKPDVGDGVETLVKPGLKKEIKKEVAQKGAAATKLDIKVLKAGTEAGSGYKHYIDIDANLLKREIILPDDLNNPKLRAKFDKHGKFFGMEGMNFNKENAELFKQKIRAHINDPDTIGIAGTYTTGGVGDVVHFYNPRTKVNVMKDMDGQFVSGWKLREKQQEFLKLKGQIGGQK